MKVGKVKLGWRALESILNDLIDAVNQNEPVAGSGISVSSSGAGSQIDVKNQGAPPGDSGTSGTDITVATPTGGPTEGGWMTVTIVDPGSCTQQEIQVWAKSV